MNMEMTLLNLVLIILLTVLTENGLRKSNNSESKSVKRTFGFYVMPTYVLSLIFSILVLFPSIEINQSLLFDLQKYSIGAYILSCLLFIASIDGARTIAKAGIKNTIK